MACATTPTAATATATAKRRRWATNKTATVAAGVAVADRAASSAQGQRSGHRPPQRHRHQGTTGHADRDVEDEQPGGGT